jgi:hypothetical protein
VEVIPRQETSHITSSPTLGAFLINPGTELDQYSCDIAGTRGIRAHAHTVPLNGDEIGDDCGLIGSIPDEREHVGQIRVVLVPGSRGSTNPDRVPHVMQDLVAASVQLIVLGG